MWETSPYTVVLQAGLGAAPGVLVVEKLNVSWQCALVAWKAKCTLDRIRSGVSSRAGSGLSLCHCEAPFAVLHTGLELLARGRYELLVSVLIFELTLFTARCSACNFVLS